MKLPRSLPKNVLKDVLKVFSVGEPQDLTTEHLDDIADILSTSNILCESHWEVVQCLRILQDMGVLYIEEHYLKEEDSLFYRISLLPEYEKI